MGQTISSVYINVRFLATYINVERCGICNNFNHISHLRCASGVKNAVGTSLLVFCLRMGAVASILRVSIQDFHSCTCFALALLNMSHNMRFPTMWYVRPAKAQTSLRIRAVWSEPLLVAWIFSDSYATYWISFVVSKLNRRLYRLVWVYTCQNATLLKITCRGSYFKMLNSSPIFSHMCYMVSVFTFDLLCVDSNQMASDMPADLKLHCWQTSIVRAHQSKEFEEIKHFPQKVTCEK